MTVSSRPACTTGFRSVEIVGRNTGVSLPAGGYYDRPVIHAVR